MNARRINIWLGCACAGVLVLAFFVYALSRRTSYTAIPPQMAISAKSSVLASSVVSNLIDPEEQSEPKKPPNLNLDHGVTLAGSDELSVDAQSTEQTMLVPRLDWIREYGRGDQVHTAQAFAFGQKGNVFVAGTSSRAGGSGENAAFWVWEVSRDGDIRREWQLEDDRLPHKISAMHPYFTAMTMTPEGNLLLAVDLHETPRSIILVDSGGVVLAFLPISDRTTGIRIATIVGSADGTYIFAGGSNSGPFAAKVDSLGHPIWEDIWVDKPYGRYVGAVADASGCVLLAIDDHLDSGERRVLLRRITHDGAVMDESHLPGTGASICLMDGAYRVAYDSVGSSLQDISVMTYDDELRAGASTQIVTPAEGGDRFAMSCFESGYLIGMTDRLHLRVSLFSPDNKLLWSFLDDKRVSRRHWIFRHLLSSGGTFWTLSSVYTENDLMNYKVGIAKFTIGG